jgi:hypothetical protein
VAIAEVQCREVIGASLVEEHHRDLVGVAHRAHRDARVEQRAPAALDEQAAVGIEDREMTRRVGEQVEGPIGELEPPGLAVVDARRHAGGVDRVAQHHGGIESREHSDRCSNVHARSLREFRAAFAGTRASRRKARAAPWQHPRCPGARTSARRCTRSLDNLGATRQCPSSSKTLHLAEELLDQQKESFVVEAPIADHVTHFSHVPFNKDLERKRGARSCSMS